MRFRTLDEWLIWQATLHSRTIDLGLERIREVADSLGLLEPGVPVITIAGTNGKGSCAAYMEAILQAAGYRTGTYTSPHLLRYNERIRINGREVDDASLMDAFEAIDRARGETSLSYFEFGTLAAFRLFRRAGVDVYILEVGLGGRLDAVNLLDADVALIVSVGLDHSDWLGHDAETIGREKAGILRPNRPAVFAGALMPSSISEVAHRFHTPLLQAGRDYTWTVNEDGSWDWQGVAGSYSTLPEPGIPGRVQYANAAGVVAALREIACRLPVSATAIRRGLLAGRLDGRLQRLPGAVEWLLDVAHNADSARVLADTLNRDRPLGRRLAVVALMRRKDREAVLAPLRDLMDGWYLLVLPEADTWSPEELQSCLPAGRVLGAGEAASLLPVLNASLRDGDQVVVFGSFRTVEEVLRYRIASTAA